MSKIAYFVSPHGFGHAARASAVMAALHALDPAIEFDIYTRVPAWFFEDSLGTEQVPFRYHSLLTDIGLVQQNSLREDLPATIDRLDAFLPFDSELIDGLAGEIAGCRGVICDIAPLGIAVAKKAGLPAVLIENFTWDWIYEGYPEYATGLAPHIRYLRALFQSADLHIQTEPVCWPHSPALTAAPVARRNRAPAAEIRGRLGLANHTPLVVLTMGGAHWSYTFLDQLARYPDVHFTIAIGLERDGLHSQGNLTVLSRDDDIFHPDLINAADAVVGKVGYSTLAEVYRAGTPYGYVPRPQFRESPHLVAYIEANMPGLSISEPDILDGQWLASLPDLLGLPKAVRDEVTGADEVARFILDNL